MDSNTLCFPRMVCTHPITWLFTMEWVGLVGFVLINIVRGLREPYRKGQLKLFHRHPLKETPPRVEVEKDINQKIADGLTTIIFMAVDGLFFVSVQSYLVVSPVEKSLILAGIAAIGVFIPVRESLFRIVNDELDRWRLV